MCIYETLVASHFYTTPLRGLLFERVKFSFIVCNFSLLILLLVLLKLQGFIFFFFCKHNVVNGSKLIGCCYYSIFVSSLCFHSSKIIADPGISFLNTTCGTGFLFHDFTTNYFTA